MLFLPEQLWLQFTPEAQVGRLTIHPPPGTELIYSQLTEHQKCSAGAQ